MDGNRLRAAAFAMAALLVFAGALQAQTAPNGLWQNEPTSPFADNGTGNHNFATDATGSNLYMCDSYKTFGRLNLLTNTWTPLANMPYQVYANALVIHNGTVYSFGSLEYPPLPVGVSTPLDPVLKYSIANDAAGWTTLPGKLHAHGYGATADVVGTKIIITGGMRNSDSPLGSGRSDAVTEFDPATDALAARTPMPVKLRLHSSAYLPSTGKLYLFGGNVEPPPPLTTLQSAATFEYTPRVVAADGTVTPDKWTTKADITVDGVPYSRNRPFAFVLGGRIFLAGGSHADAGSTTLTYLTQCLEYRPASNDWIRWTDMGWARAAAAVGVGGGAAHIVGGTDGTTGTGLDTSREAFYPPGSSGPPPVVPTPTPSTNPGDPSLPVAEDGGSKDKCAASSAGGWSIALLVLLAMATLRR